METGQTMAYVALALITLLAMVALAVDVGLAYSARRHMQNAADAGALAGAQALCRGEGADGARAAAQRYAVANNAQTANVTVTQVGRGGSVTVVARNPVNTYFAGVVGLRQVNVVADAQAVCGPVSTGRACGIAPMAFPYQQWQQVKGQCGREFIVIDSDKVCGQDVVCNLNNGDRGWLDLPHVDLNLYDTPCVQSCGQATTRCYLENDYPAPIALPACIRAQPGVAATNFRRIGDFAGRIMRVPLCDRGCGWPGDPSPAGSCGGQSSFHVVDFGCIQIVEGGQGLPKAPPAHGNDNSVKWLKARVSCSPECFQGCNTARQAGGEAGDVLGIGMLR
ncbi:MAG: Tad domain-containing protein [Anaerolineae bacterium]|nr:Tad domain-containing protein [Anaerolineae bacterium]